MKKIHAYLEKLAIPNWLAVLLFATLVLRIPSFSEPYYYGDEMIYMTLGQGIRQGITLYSGIFDNKPPVIYLITALAGSLVWFKVFLALAATVSIVFFAKILRELFVNNVKLQKVATVIFALLITLPFWEGNTANAENFLMAFSLSAIYLLVAKKHSFKNLLAVGVLFALAVLTKVPAIFDIPIVILFWLITGGINKKSLTEISKKTLVIALGFLIPITLTFLWFYAKKALPDFVTAAFLQNVGYVSSWRPGDIQKSFLVRNLPLLIRAGIVAIGMVTLYVFRKKLSKPFIFATVWVLLALFAATLSERPYPHYLLQTAAPISILLGFLCVSKSLEQTLVFIPLFIAAFVPVYYKFWYYPTASYYFRFAKFAVGLTSKETYFSEFSQNIPRNYQISDFLTNSSRRTDRVFVWGPDSPAIYALSRRLPPGKYVADYHVNDYSNRTALAKTLTAQKPVFIVTTPEAQAFPELNPLLQTNYLLINRIGGAEIYAKHSL